MSSYTLRLTPTLVNRNTEGSLDTSVSGGVSIQRTAYLDVYNSTNRKVLELEDGEAFNDTMETFSDYTFVE